MYKQGKFKTFAISNFTAAEVAEVCLLAKFNGWVRPTLYQGKSLSSMPKPFA
jgi:aflatoxin B1 aldehyde reductase